MPALRRWPSIPVPGLVAASGLALVCLIAGLLVSRERELQAAHLDEIAERHFQSMDRVHQSRLLYQYGLNSFFAASDTVSLDDLYEHLLSAEPERPLTGTIGYAPRVTGLERPWFESSAAEKLRMAFGIWSQDKEGSRQPAVLQKRHLPVTYVWPLTGNESILGYDLWADETLRPALEKAAATGAPARSNAVPVIVDHNRRLGYFVFIPLYSKGGPLTSPEHRWRRLQGFTVGLYRYGTAVEQTLAEATADLHSVYVYDSEDPAAVPVYRYEPDTRFDGSAEIPDAIDLAATTALAGAWVRKVDVAGQPLTYVMVPPHPATWLSAATQGSSFIVLALGIPFVALLTYFLQRREHSVAALARTAAILRGIVETSLDIYVLLDQEGRILEWSPQAERVFGWQASNVLGTPLATVLMPPDHQPDTRQFDRVLERAAEAPVGVMHETVSLSKEGTELPLEMVINSVRLREGLRFVVFIRDVGDRRKREQELAQLSLLAAKSTNAISILDPRGRVTWVNDFFVDVFGYRIEELRGRLLQDALGGRNTAPAHIESITRGIGLRQPFRQDIQLQSKTGAEMWFEMDFTPIFDSQKVLHQIIAIGTDISARKRTERQALRVQRMEAIGQITGGLAHDFNNLLGIIVGNLDLLALQYSDDPQARQKIEVALDAALRTGQLTKSLLAVARRQPLAPARNDLGALVRDLLPLIRQAAGPDVQVVHTAGPGALVAKVDESGLQSALLHLVANARESMPGGGRLLINVSRSEEEQLPQDDLPMNPGPYVVLEVNDSGSGMAPEVAARAFEPFFTTKERHAGTGLGLAMVYGFARQSGGTATITSTPEKGTTVRLLLPALPPHEGGAPTLVPLEELPLRGNKERILLVDDEPALLDLAAHWLEELGYEVLRAPSSAEARKLLSEEPDLLFTDIVMNGEAEGLALAQSAQRKRPGMRVAFVSGYPASVVNPDDQTLPGPVLTKPYRRAELARLVRSLLDANRQRRPS